MSTLRAPHSADGLDTAPFMAFLPKKLLIRYLVFRDDQVGSNREKVRVDILYAAHDLAGRYEMLSLDYPFEVNRKVERPGVVVVRDYWGSKEVCERLLKGTLERWWASGKESYDPTGLLLQPVEFVGLLNIGSGATMLDAASPHLMHIHFHVEAFLRDRAALLHGIKDREPDVHAKAHALSSMADRFSTFVALSHHAMAERLLTNLRR